MTPTIGKLMLSVHVISTVGWIGAIAAFLALAISGLISHETMAVDSAYLAMKLIGWRVIVPLGLASVLTGLVQSLGTTWGLFRHYWVIVKLVLTVGAIGLLLLHMTLADRLAEIANQSTLSLPPWHGARIRIMADATAAIVLLIVNTVLSVYKPRGVTAYGRRKQHEECVITGLTTPVSDTAGVPRWVTAFGVTALVLLLLFKLVLAHLSGGIGHHIH